MKKPHWTRKARCGFHHIWMRTTRMTIPASTPRTLPAMTAFRPVPATGFMPLAAVFDLDHTLIAGDATIGWTEYLYERGVVTDPVFREINERIRPPTTRARSTSPPGCARRFPPTRDLTRPSAMRSSPTSSRRRSVPSPIRRALRRSAPRRPRACLRSSSPPPTPSS